MSYQSGSGGYVEVAGSRLDVTSWQAREAAEWADTTGADSGGYRESILAKRFMSGTVSADFDPSLAPKSSPAISAGSSVALSLYTASGGKYAMTANVKALRWVTPAGERISFTFDFESTGAYSYTA